jgi:hypothetical protein
VLVDGEAQTGFDAAGLTWVFPSLAASHSLVALFGAAGGSGGSGGTGVAGHQVTVVASTGGQVTPVGAAEVADGDTLDLQITPDPGYRIWSVTAGGQDVTENVDPSGALSVGPVTGDTAVAVWFRPADVAADRRVVALAAADGGQISPAGVLTVEQGGSQTFTVTPNPGYRVADVTDGDVSMKTACTASAAGAGVAGALDCALTDIGDDHLVLAMFEPAAGSGSAAPEGYVRVRAIGSVGGQIYPPGSSLIPTGGGIDLVIKPADGYEVGQVLDEGRDITDQVSAAGGTLTLDGLTADRDVFIVFVHATSGGGSGGSDTPGGDPTDHPTDNPTDNPGGGGTTAPGGSGGAGATGPGQGGGAGGGAGTSPSTPAGPGAVAVKAALAAVTLVKGKGYKLVASGYTAGGAPVAVTYRSAKAKVATVSASGKVKAKKPGKAVITVTSGGVSTKVKVTVLKKKPAGAKATVKTVKVKLAKRLGVGAAAFLAPKLGPKTALAVKVTFTSSKKAVAAVDKAGRLQALAPGKAVIKVKAGKAVKKLKLTVR